MANVGFRIFTRIDRPAAELVQSFKGLPTSNIADNMSRFGGISGTIKPINDCPLIGTALTVKSTTADNLLLHKAIDMAKPGDVIVVDVQGDITNSVMGEIMVRVAMKKGISGFVIDGAIRDVGALKKLDIPIYAKGSTPKGPYKEGPGEINVPISCGGLVVHPGDIVVGDEDGVVVISPRDAQEVLEKTITTFKKEQQKFKQIEEGTFDRSWVDQLLVEKGCEIIES